MLRMAELAVGDAAPDLVLLDAEERPQQLSAVWAKGPLSPETRHIRIIGMTGQKLSDDKTKFIRSKSDGLYRKPLDPVSIVRRAAELLKMELKEK